MVVNTISMIFSGSLVVRSDRTESWQLATKHLETEIAASFSQKYGPLYAADAAQTQSFCDAKRNSRSPGHRANNGVRIDKYR